MSQFETITVLISLAVLVVSVWHFKRISDLDRKEEYKSKGSLFHDAYSETMSLIEKTENRTNFVNEKRLSLSSIKSPYVSSFGCSQGHSAILVEIRKTNPIKEKLVNLCSELEGITKKEDKEAFDRCMEIKVEVKNISLELNKILSKAEFTINDMHSMAHAQKEHA
ncbi:hypothetical protein PE36_08011 [Moritella sp. PE36]|uniref:hypothetical protein n=1 Tax=Moritella sp. PE36 TaxID=58051 RepID=UPI0001568C86|nr:hypothetical protein [Moritella sp. PE36]EDM65930.1 hypothetical protein PE36_08011 [Moritella sp. PE36]